MKNSDFIQEIIKKTKNVLLSLNNEEFLERYKKSEEGDLKKIILDAGFLVDFTEQNIDRLIDEGVNFSQNFNGIQLENSSPSLYSNEFLNDYPIYHAIAERKNNWETIASANINFNFDEHKLYYSNESISFQISSEINNNTELGSFDLWKIAA